MGEKSRANEPLSREELKKQNKKETKIILTCLFVIIPLVAVFFTVWFLVEPRVSPEITVGNGIVTVKGLYPQEIDLQGATVTLSDISKVPVDKRIAGSNYPNAGVSKGKFRSSEDGAEVYLSLMNTRIPHIVIDNGKRFYINRKTAEETRALYDKILAETEKMCA